MEHLKTARLLYGERSVKATNFFDLKVKSLLASDILLPVAASFSYERIFKLYEERTGSKIVSAVGSIMNCSAPDESLLDQRNSVMPDRYLIAINKGFNKEHRTVHNDHIPRNGVLNLREYLLLDMLNFLETHRHLDELEYFTAGKKDNLPHSVSLGTSFRQSSPYCFPKLYHHNKMLTIDLHSLAQSSLTYYRTFKIPIVYPENYTKR